MHLRSQPYNWSGFVAPALWFRWLYDALQGEPFPGSFLPTLPPYEVRPIMLHLHHVLLKP